MIHPLVDFYLVSEHQRGTNHIAPGFPDVVHLLRVTAERKHLPEYLRFSIKQRLRQHPSSILKAFCQRVRPFENDVLKVVDCIL